MAIEHSESASLGRFRRQIWNRDTNLRHRPVGEMEILSLVENRIGIPFFQWVSKVARMFLAAELSSQKIVATVWQNEGAVFVQIVDNLHVVVARACIANCLHNANEFKLRRLDENHLGA